MRTEEIEQFAVDQDGIYYAVVHLLEGQGAYGVREDVLVKKLVTPAGRTLYVVSGINRIAPSLEIILARAIPFQPGHGNAGVWVLREQDAQALIRSSKEPEPD